MKTKKIAIIRIRGTTGLDKGIESTLKMLRLIRKFSCVVVDATPSNLGMIQKVKDYVTYGEITEETYKQLVEKRGELYADRTEDSKGKIKYNKFVKIGDKLYKPYFRLNPPVGGFERKGTKIGFSVGGVLGDRKEKINELIVKMI